MELIMSGFLKNAIYMTNVNEGGQNILQTDIKWLRFAKDLGVTYIQTVWLKMPSSAQHVGSISEKVNTGSSLH
jgi:hypothetical protein